MFWRIFMKNKIVVLGSGRLASEIIAQRDRWSWIARRWNHFDFNSTDWYHRLHGFKIVINCIANTNTYSKERDDHWKTNYTSVLNLVDYCNRANKKLIHISTDYIYSGSKENATEEDIPVHNKTWYAYTKLLSDAYIQARSRDYLLIRTSFKENPWQFDNAITTQVGNTDYTDKIASLIIQLIEKGAEGIYNVGREKSGTLYDLAIQTKPDVIESSGILNKYMPRDVSMNVDKMIKRLSDE